jgi:uncharacterized protein (DUF1501 family)
VPEDRVLVIVQLGGGNDGLNTVIPYGDDLYHRARPGIALSAPGRNRDQNRTVLPLDERAGIGLHPSMTGFRELFDEGVASIVQGVGYPNPNRSHFASMDIWHTANEHGKGNGWIGRYFDNTCQGRPLPEGAVAIGNTAPLAMHGDVQKPISFESADLFRWLGADLDPSLKEPYDAINRRGPLDDADDDSQMGFLTRTALDAQVSSDRIRTAVAKTPLVSYPGNALARQLRIVSAMIRDEMKTRVYYTSMGGFDTHANQFGQHANLLRRFSGAVTAFYRDLKAQGNHERVLVVAFSEFGRRVAQNASGGTDHGCAAPMFLVGDMTLPGLLGRHPSLSRLDHGDLVYGVDFRSVYAAVLEDWMGAPSQPILGRSFRKAQIIRT